MNHEVYMSLNDGERALVEWQYRMAGGFTTSLFELMSQADNSNLNRLSRAFPEHVAAFRDYAHERNWWTDLRNRLDMKSAD